MKKYALCVALLLISTGFEITYASPLIYADGDLAPLGSPDGLIDPADYFIANRIALGQISATELELSHGDVYPVSAPDGLIDIRDMLLIQKKVLGQGGSQGSNRYVQNLNLFEDGPSTVSAEVNGTTTSTTVTVDGYTGPGATVTSNPNFTDPEDYNNAIWHVSISGGIANVFLGTADLSADPVLDTGYDLSGNGSGQLVFDIKVNSITPGTALTVKIDSGYPDLGQVLLSPAQYTVGSWRRVTLDFSDLLADPGPGGGLDLGNVVNIFVIEVTGGSADFYLDNIFVSNACPVIGGCNATVKTKPIIDSDGDGVPDSSDLCPNTAPGTLVNPSGCPILADDADNDGVSDNNDLCPNTPVNTVVDANGCAIVSSLLSATATASSSGPAGGASLAVDGNMSSRWESAQGIDPSWITLDLGANYALSEVIIHWEAANAANYEIQGSTNNSDWTTLSSETGGQFGNRTDNVNITGTYRYVRMHGLSRSSPYGYSIFEMEVYGVPASDTDGDGVDDSIDQCPGTPPGSIVNANGCIDEDNDGVIDGIDQCPATPLFTPVDATGCTLPLPVNEVSSLNDILTGGDGASLPGFTLYVFDNDVGSAGSNCNGSCATNWPPVLVTDGGATGVSDLETITRNDGSLQVTYQGRPLYYFAGDANTGDTNGDGSGGVWWKVPYIETYEALFGLTTVLEPALQEDTPAALITHLADRARDRHAREDQFQIYDHYLSFYWEHRTAEIEIVDTIGKGGNTITFNVITEWPLHPNEAELRFFHINEAIYANNGVMSAVPSLDVPGETRRHYTRTLSYNQKENRPLQVGDNVEFELSQFLTGTPNGRDNYYGTAILYVAGQGVVPWEARGPAQNSFPMPEAGKLGGGTTLPYQYSDEPDNHFMQMPTNLSNINGQTFVLGRRVHHTDFEDGSHNEAITNPPFTELANKLGTYYINHSCVSCHAKNGRALPPGIGQTLDKYVVKVGDASGNPDPQVGAVLQPESTVGATEGNVSISSWSESNGLRSPNYSFSGVAPTNFSARIAPQLVGMGLLEAIVEVDIQALADPNDADGDGISGRIQRVTDAATGESRIGRFGWKATQPTVRQQVAAAFNTDMGVMTSLMPNPDCGASQTNCGPSGSELSDQHLDELSAYVSLLGVSARRDLADPVALQGEALFDSAGCTGCHTDTFQTSPNHPHAELRDQTIHPYTDLLLHDMGPGLASSLIEGKASGAEWRTPPLWNIGLTAGVSFGEAYLHDGRARNLNEAILWHGGEAETSKQVYSGMSQSEKDALIAFLRSL